MSIYDDNQSAGRETPEAELALPEWTPRRRELLKWFLDEAPSLAPAYKAAVQLLSMPAMPARVHLVCHIVRDMYAKLPEILVREYRFRSYGDEIKSFVTRVEVEWKQSENAFLTERASPSAEARSSDQTAISESAAQTIGRLLERHRILVQQAPSGTTLARTLYERYAEAHPDPPNRLVNRFKEELHWFVRRAHLVLRVADIPTEDGLNEHFESFEHTLYSLVGGCFQGQKEIDDFLDRANQRTD